MALAHVANSFLESFWLEVQQVCSKSRHSLAASYPATSLHQAARIVRQPAIRGVTRVIASQALVMVQRFTISSHKIAGEAANFRVARGYLDPSALLYVPLGLIASHVARILVRKSC